MAQEVWLENTNRHKSQPGLIEQVFYFKIDPTNGWSGNEWNKRLDGKIYGLGKIYGPDGKYTVLAEYTVLS